MSVERINMSLEVEDTGDDPAGDTPAGEAAANGGITIDSTKPADKKPESERPDWLPEGFDSPEAMAKAYAELRTKMSKEGAPKKDAPAADKAAEKPAADKAAENESDTAIRTAITAVAGDEASLKSVLEWAKVNATDAAVENYNAALKSGNTGLAALAFGAIQAEHSEAVGSDPKLLEVENAGRTAGVKPFASEHEMVRAMSDRRYKEGDPAYHAEVDARLAVSNNIF
jgi:hypothetical protein